MAEITEGERWLARVHDAQPGATPLAFAGLQDDTGKTSYDHLLDRVPEGALLLDLACGDGHLLEAARRRGIRGVGVDMSRGELALAALRLGEGAGLVRARAQQLPFEDRRFDHVTCHLALMLMDPVEPVLEEVGRVLRPGGGLGVVVGGGVEGSWHVLLEELRREAQVMPRLGDPRVRAPDTLASLLARHFQAVSERIVYLPLGSEPARLWSHFAGMYDSTALGPERLDDLRRRVFARWQDEPPGPTRLRLRVVEATRPA